MSTTGIARLARGRTMMLAAATALAAVLLPGGSALPQHVGSRGSALTGIADSAAKLTWAELDMWRFPGDSPGVTEGGDVQLLPSPPPLPPPPSPGDIARVTRAVLKQPAGQLWFWSIDESSRTGPPANNSARCGEVDAAPFMPAALFDRTKPLNFAALVAYAAATERFYPKPVGNSSTKLQVGRCRDQAANWVCNPTGNGSNYTSCDAGVQGVVWTPGSLMGPVCQERCQCSFNGAVPGLPLCKDRPDNPSASKWCSLCGPSTACPGCAGDTVTIGLCSPTCDPRLCSC